MHSDGARGRSMLFVRCLVLVEEETNNFVLSFFFLKGTGPDTREALKQQNTDLYSHYVYIGYIFIIVCITKETAMKGSC